VPSAAATTAPEPQPTTIEERMTRLHAHSGRGRRPYSDLVRDTLGSGETREWGIAIEPGHCYSILAVGSPGVEDLDIYLFDPGAWQVAWDRGRDSSPVVRICPSVAGEYRLRVKMYGGSGEYGLQVFGDVAVHANDPSTSPRPLRIAAPTGPSAEADPE